MREAEDALLNLSRAALDCRAEQRRLEQRENVETDVLEQARRERLLGIHGGRRKHPRVETVSDRVPVKRLTSPPETVVRPGEESQSRCRNRKALDETEAEPRDRCPKLGDAAAPARARDVRDP